MRLLIIGSVFLGAMGIFIWMGIIEGSIPALAIQDLKAKAFEKECWINGSEANPVVIRKIEKTGQPLVFLIGPEHSPDILLRVTSPRNPPENFEVGRHVTVRGHFKPGEDSFAADEVRTACPSKYEASKDVMTANLKAAAAQSQQTMEPPASTAPAAAPSGVQ